MNKQAQLAIKTTAVEHLKRCIHFFLVLIKT